MKVSKVLRVLSTAASAGSILLALDMGSSGNPVNAIAIGIGAIGLGLASHWWAVDGDR
jgi:hypothetical protein